MSAWLPAVAIGLASGVLSGMFGIGGGILTTPAIRLLLGAPALIAVGTPLPVILPGALTGAFSYARRGVADVRGGLLLGAAGILTSVAGAWATRFAGGSVVLVGTAVLIAWAAADMALQIARPPAWGGPGGAESDAEAVPAAGHGVQSAERASAPSTRAVRLALTGLLAGFYSGFFGLGGGFVIVPLLTRWLRFPVKRAIGTSLVAVTLLAVPGTITHAVLGNVDWGIAALLAIGVVPGAALGARLNAAVRDVAVRVALVAVLIVAAAWLALTELGVFA